MNTSIRRESPSPAEAAYNAHRDWQSWKWSNGKTKPEWNDETMDVKAAWEAAACAAIVWVRVRDRFAQGALSAMRVEADCDPQDVAYKAYEIGEAMMRERQRRWEQRMQAHQRREAQ